MKGKSLIAENRELAFRIYCRCGGNVEMTLREMAKEGLTLSKPTFYDWMEKFNFEERRTKVDAETQKAKDSQLSFDDKMLGALLKQKEKYETYFETLTIPDHQAQYAYAGIIKTIFDIRSRTASFKTSLFIGFMKDLINFYSKNDPAVVALIESSFDDFMTFAREKYAA
ncbi:MAG: hypothetical protein HZB62_10720 [Nitrospirae bacterium]|nr:hypothetical protein [Nitrospirota bacterium]